MDEAKLIEVLFPHLARVSVEQVEDGGDVVRIHARPRADAAACAMCGVESASVHSRYQRRLADLVPLEKSSLHVKPRIGLR